MDQIKSYLEKLTGDIRDFSHHKVYGTVKPPLVDFDISDLPAIILDQSDLDFCTGFASSELNTNIQNADSSLVNYLVSKKLSTSLAYRSTLALKYKLVTKAQEYIDLAIAKSNSSINLKILSKLMEEYEDYFCPLYQFSKIKQVRGEYMSWGANLRDACKALVKFGSLPKRLSPYSYRENPPTDRDRDWLADWTNWPLALDQEARKNALESFWVCDGPFDAFDNIRSVLYKNYKAGWKVGVLFGLNWRPEWSQAVVKGCYGTSQGSPHCIWLRGQKIINGEAYIVLQQSGGYRAGDNGLYYLDRDTINKEFAAGYGAFTFKDLPIKTAGYFIENGIMAKDNWLTAMFRVAGNFVSGIIKAS